MLVILKIKTGEITQDYILHSPSSATLGRGESANCQVSDAKMSSLHCKLNFTKDRLELTDLNSKNGTFLNGIRIEHSQVFLGDQILIGDSQITLDEKDLEADSKEVLTFPGVYKDRLDNELRADFTGARIKNQLSKKSSSSKLHQNEVSIRKKAHTKIKLSKEELKEKYPLQALIALVIDMILTILILYTPIVLMDKLSVVGGQIKPPTRMLGLMIFEPMILILFYNLNFKRMKFSLGEIIAGVRTKYLKQ